MTLVLSSQCFSLLYVVSVGNVSLSLVRSNEISRLKNVSPYVSFKGPLVHSYENGLVPYVSTFTQFFSLFCRLISNHYYVRTILLSLPLQRFSLRNVVRMILVFSSQRFSVGKYVHRFISLAFSTLLHTLLARSHFTGLVFPRLSVS